MYSYLKTDIVEEERDQGPALHGQYKVPAPKLGAFLYPSLPGSVAGADSETAAAPNILDGELGLP